MRGVFDVRDDEACGDGIHDDTPNLQCTADKAAAVGGEMFISPGMYKTTAPVNVSDRITIRGVGYQDDGGNGYNPIFTPFYPIPSSLVGSVILPGAHTTFNITSNRAVKLCDFQISYSQNAASGSNIPAISVAPASGCNSRSIFRDLCITNCDRGMLLTNCMEYRVDNVNVLYFWQDGIITDSPLYPSYGDSCIQNCTLWGDNGAAGHAHIWLKSGGGIRIVNNKLQAGSHCSGIFVNPCLTNIQQYVEPLIISDNSIEGQAVGINIANGNVNHANISEVSITGGNIWSNYNAVRINTNGVAQWLNSLSLVGVSLMSVGATGGPIVQLDNIQSAIITGNTYNFSGGGSGIGNYLGVYSAGVNIQSNRYGAGVSPAGGTLTGNSIGGGFA